MNRIIAGATVLLLSATLAAAAAEPVAGGVLPGNAPAGNAITRGERIIEPPNKATLVTYDAAKSTLSMAYRGGTIMTAEVFVERDGKRIPARGTVTCAADAKITQRQGVDKIVTQDILLAATGKEPIVLNATVLGSDEAFSAETLGAAQKRFPLIRTAVGLSQNLRNNAIYDRRYDWMLAVEGSERIRIDPVAADQGIRFGLSVTGNPVRLAFRPRFYQKHKSLRFYEPWKYQVRKDSITGWCSWFAYGMSRLNQQVVADTAAAMAGQRLNEFGYRFFQMDLGYQNFKQPDPVQVTLNWDAQRFPDGFPGFLKMARGYGFEPGTWVGSLKNQMFCVNLKPDWFVSYDKPKSPVSDPAKVHPINEAMAGEVFEEHGRTSQTLDVTNREAVDAWLRPIYRGLKEAGVAYVKIDNLRHQFYDTLNRSPAFLKRTGLDSEQTVRRYVEIAREELGPDVFVLSCWGVLPEVIGIADGCRIGGDGFNEKTLGSYNSWNGVVWRNDPDHIQLRRVEPFRKEAKPTPTPDPLRVTANGIAECPVDSFRAPCIVSMAGGMIMLTDKAEVYKDPRNLEGAKRSAPVLFSVPGQLYDYDPGKSDAVISVPRSSVVGKGSVVGEEHWMASSPLDGGGQMPPWWLMEIDRPWEHWVVLGRFGSTSATEVRFADLGLPADRDYLVYEFWSRKFSVSKDVFTAMKGGSGTGVEMYAIRKKLDRPQIVSTSRHISQGGVDLKKVQWNKEKRELSGESDVVQEDPYTLVLHVPTGWSLAEMTIAGQPARVETDGPIIRCSTTPVATGNVTWRALFR